MATRSEQIALVVSAKDQASGILRGIQSQVIGIGAAYLSWRGVSALIGSIVDASKEAEKATLSLRSAVQRQGLDWTALGDQLQQFATDVQHATGISDELVQRGLARLINFGFSAAEAMRTLRVATDLATEKEIDLMSAVDLIAKAHAGNTGALSRYIGTVKEGATPLETFNNQMQRLTSFFGGAATAQMHTMEGATNRLKEAWGDLLEWVSKTQAWAYVRGILVGLAVVLEEYPKIIQAGIIELASWMKAFSAAFYGAGSIASAFGRLLADVLSGNYVLAAASFEGLKAATSKAVSDVRAALIMASEATGAWFDVTTLTWSKAVEEGTKAAGDAIIRASEKIGDEASQAFLKKMLVTEQILRGFNAQINQELRIGKEPEAGVGKASLDAGVDLQLDAIGIIDSAKEQAWENASARLKEETTGVKSATAQWINAVEKFKENAGVIIGQFTHSMARSLATGEGSISDAFNRMAQDFITYFIEQALNSIITMFIPGLTGLLGGIFDNPVNDAMAARQGADYIKHFTRGGMEQLRDLEKIWFSGFNPVGVAPAFAGASGGTVININFHGPVTDRDYVRNFLAPQLEREIRSRRLTFGRA